jgi:polygalacturonase
VLHSSWTNQQHEMRHSVLMLILTWLVLLPTVRTVVTIVDVHNSSSECVITDFGAVAGNKSTDAKTNTLAIQQALTQCEAVVVPKGAFKILPITIPSHRILRLDSAGSLVGSDVWQEYGTTRFMPPMGRAMQLRPLISATNATNITITGMNGTIDGNGWYAWPVANWSSPECGLHKKCAGSTFFGTPGMKLRPPHVLTFTRCTGVTLRNVTITNPPFWGVQHFFCNQSSHSHVTILAPRWTREIAGFMPWSVLDYTVEDSYVHVGVQCSCCVVLGFWF